MNKKVGKSAFNASLVGFALVLFVGLSQIASYFGQLILAALDANMAAESSYLHNQWLMGLFNLVAAIAVYLPPVLVLSKLGKKAGFSLKQGKSKVRVVLLLPLFLGVMLVANAISSLMKTILQALTGGNIAATSELPQDALSVILYFITSCVLTALFEETLFRGYIQPMLAGFGQKQAIVVSSLIFTFLHSSILELPAIFILSMLLGYVAVISGSVRPCIVLHFANNTFSFIMRLANRQMETMAAVIFTFLLIIAEILLFCGAVWWVRHQRLGRKFRVPKEVGRGVTSENRNKKLYQLPVFLLGVFVVLAQFVLFLFA